MFCYVFFLLAFNPGREITRNISKEIICCQVKFWLVRWTLWRNVGSSDALIEQATDRWLCSNNRVIYVRIISDTNQKRKFSKVHLVSSSTFFYPLLILSDMQTSFNTFKFVDSLLGEKVNDALRHLLYLNHRDKFAQISFTGLGNKHWLLSQSHHSNPTVLRILISCRSQIL